MGVKTPNAADRRVQRTRRALGDALITVILERGWDETSVQDICDRADVGRSTFYTHFADKEDLLVGGLEDLGKALRDPQALPTSGRALSFARGLIEHAHEHRRLFRAIVGKRSGHVVQERFREMVIDLVRADLVSLAPAGPRRDAAVHHVAGALFGLLIWWLDARDPLPPSDAAELFHQLTRPVLAVLRGPK